MRILVAGDFYPSERVKTLIEKKEYETILGEVTSIVKSVDYAIVNCTWKIQADPKMWSQFGFN
jgi:hypothetical protein